MSFFVLLFALLTTSVSATQALENICKTVVKEGVVKANFIQKKTISGLTKPLTSTGDLILWADKGVLWAVHTPFASTILLSKNGIFQVESKLKTKLIKGPQQDNLMLDILPKILSGDFAAITEFKITVLSPAEAKNWKIQLIPGEGVAKVLTSLTIAGEKFIEHITIQRANGDKDEISLHNHSVEKTLPADLEALFNE